MMERTKEIFLWLGYPYFRLRRSWRIVRINGEVFSVTPKYLPSKIDIRKNLVHGSSSEPSLEIAF